jgi:uncharacterized protein (TIGR03084 family)
MTILDGLLADLDAETADLRTTVDRLGPDGWTRATPAAGWDVATSVAHLLWTDEVATLAARAHVDKDAWDAVVLEAIGDPDHYVDTAAAAIAAAPREEVLARWDRARAGLRDALTGLPEGTKLPWFGPPMSGASMATARFMETWAHGTDVHDAAGARPEPTDRIRHVAYLGVRTRNFAFATRGEPAPGEEFRIELTAPSGALWAWGPADAPQSVRGPAYDFCLLVTQRTHRADTALEAHGADAERWLEIAQAFAGPPGPGREALA